MFGPLAKTQLGMLGAFGVGDALIDQPGVQFIECLRLGLGPKQKVAIRADLVLDLTLCWRGNAAPVKMREKNSPACQADFIVR